MIWNHRVVKHTNENAAFEDEKVYYTIEECFYHGEDHDNPSLHTHHLSLYGSSVDELRETLHRMLRCLEHPVVDALSDKSDEPNITIGDVGNIKELCGTMYEEDEN